MSRGKGIGLGLGLAALAWGLSSASSRRSSPSAGSPVTSSRIEAYAERDPASTCDPTEKPGVRAFARYVLSRFGGRDLGIVRDCAKGGPSEHHEGRAWDWGITTASAFGTPRIKDFLSWVFAADRATGEPNGVIRRAGIMYLVFDRHIWRAYAGRRWEPYAGTSPHTDHVHISFSRPGAQGKTSFYSGGP